MNKYHSVVVLSFLLISIFSAVNHSFAKELEIVSDVNLISAEHQKANQLLAENNCETKINACAINISQLEKIGVNAHQHFSIDHVLGPKGEMGDEPPPGRCDECGCYRRCCCDSP